MSAQRVFSVEDLSKYVIPTSSDTIDGCGVFCGNLFITAGHLFNDGPVLFWYEGKRYFFSEKKALVFSSDENNPLGFDVAIFEVDGVNSPIDIFSEEPIVGQHLTSISYLHKSVPINSVNPSPLLSKSNEESWERLVSSAIVDSLEGNFFLCNTSIVLAPGSSGSPIFAKDKLIGILHGGLVGDPLCAFQSTKSILNKYQFL